MSISSRPLSSTSSQTLLAFCDIDSVLLDADSSAFAFYNWNIPGQANFSSDSAIFAKTNGQYTVDVFDTNGCRLGSDTVFLQFNNSPVVSLGNDTAACDSLILTAGTFANTLYIWNGDTTLSAAITADTSGQYILLAYDTLTTCSASDTINVIIGTTPVVMLGPDTTLCADSLILDAGAFTNASYLWSTGDTTQTISVIVSDTYSVIVTDTLATCEGKDTVVVNIFDASIAITGDTMPCFGDTTILTAEAGFTNYLWNTGQTTQSISVATPGVYSVSALSPAGCVVRNSTTVLSKNLPAVCINTVPDVGYGTYRVSTLAGTGTAGFSTARGLNAQFNQPWGLMVGDNNDLFVGDRGNHVIRRILLSDTSTAVFAGQPGVQGTTDSLNRLNVTLRLPFDMIQDNVGRIYVTEGANNSIRVIDTNDVMYTIAGSLDPFQTIENREGQGRSARFNDPWGLAIDYVGNLYTADFDNHNIKKIDTSGFVSVFAGDSAATPNPATIDGIGYNARLNWPVNLSFDLQQNLYVGEQGSHVIRRITLDRAVQIYAGSISGYADGPISSALFSSPYAVAIDKTGAMHVTDRGNSIIRKISADSLVTTVAGKPGQAGFTNGLDTNARFSAALSDIVLDEKTGIFYVADFGNHVIRTIEIEKTASICQGDSLFVSAGCSDADSYQWTKDGVFFSSDSAINIADSALYVIQITKNGCTNTDSIRVNFSPKPNVSLTADSLAFCSGDSTTLTSIRSHNLCLEQ